MIKVNIAEAKAKLSRYLARVREGEVVQICRRNVPVAELRAVPQRHRRQVRIGVAKGEYEVPPSFFEPLPDDVLRAFWGEDS